MTRTAFWTIAPLSMMMLMDIGWYAAADVLPEEGAGNFTIDFTSISGETEPVFPDGGGSLTGDYGIDRYGATHAKWNLFPEIGENDLMATSASRHEGALFVTRVCAAEPHVWADNLDEDGTLRIWSIEEAENGTDPYRDMDALYFSPEGTERGEAGCWNIARLRVWAASAAFVPGLDVDAINNNAWIDALWNIDKGSEETDGAHNTTGTVWEWLKNPNDSHYVVDSPPGWRGGGIWSICDPLQASNRVTGNRTTERKTVRIHVARCSIAVPEPASVLAWLGLVVVAVKGWRRGK